MTARYNYNRQVFPPAPFVYVSITRPDADDQVTTNIPNIPAQIDTAADFSVIPTNFVQRLQLMPCDQIPVAGLGEHVSIEPMYLAVLQIHQFAPLTLPVLSVKNEPFVLLGRDILNRFRIVLDGPKLLMDIE